MPSQTQRIEEQQDWAEDNDKQLPYVSKSRLKQYKECAESFRYKYILGIREPENFWMVRGSNIHEIFEDYYANLIEFVEGQEGFPSHHELINLLPDHKRWHSYTEPFMSNFITWEKERFDRVESASLPAERALPVGVEREGWVESPLGIDDELPDGVEEAPWMGFSDAVFDGVAFGYDEGEGNVIVDFKTGSVPDDKYRDEGIYLEGEYYSMIFESNGMNVAGVAGYYPKEGVGGTFVESPSSPSRRANIRETIKEMQLKTAEQPNHLPINENPLCRYGDDPCEGCLYEPTCSSTWANPIKNEEKFRELVDTGLSAGEIADTLDMNNQDPVHYWAKKLDLSISNGYYATN